ncbi:MAG: hypothetical protein WBI40_06820 [Methylococcaceae bacterium]
MTKCLSCGYVRHDFELNCPECGSFYSKISENLVSEEKSKKADAVILETNVEEQKNFSLKERFLQLFR